MSIGIASAACFSLPVEPDRLAYVTELDAPDSLPAQTPLTVGLRYEYGACDVERRVDTEVRGRVITIAVILSDAPSRLDACVTSLRSGSTLAFVENPPPGDVVLRVSRPGLPPLERAIVVAAP